MKQQYSEKEGNKKKRGGIEKEREREGETHTYVCLFCSARDETEIIAHTMETAVAAYSNAKVFLPFYTFFLLSVPTQHNMASSAGGSELFSSYEQDFTSITDSIKQKIEHQIPTQKGGL